MEAPECNLESRGGRCTKEEQLVVSHLSHRIVRPWYMVICASAERCRATVHWCVCSLDWNLPSLTVVHC
jgi:hypothetical protein